MAVKMKKGAAVLRDGPKKGVASRLPVARSEPARLSGRGGEKTVAVWSDFGDDLEDLPELAMQLVEINKRKADLEIEAGTIRGAIKQLMGSVRSDESWTVRDEDTEWVATYIVPKPGKKLEPTLLLSAGVTKKQLERGYKVVPAKKPYVQVRTKGEETESNEEHE